MSAFLKRAQCSLIAGSAGVAAGAALLLLTGGTVWWLATVLLLLALGVSLYNRRLDSRVHETERGAELPALAPVARAVLEHLPDPLMLVDNAGKVQFANRAMREAIGAAGAVERKPVSSLLRMPSVFGALAHSSATGESAATEFTVRVPVERHYKAYTAKIGSDPPVISLLLHDLTALKRAEQMRVDFVANASHELRTPLAAVAGFIETLKGPAKDDVEARDKFLDIMLVEAERMRRLIDDLLSLSRIELNEHVPPRGETAMENLVREAVAALGPLARAEDIAVTVTAEADLPKVVGERDELIQLIQNLVHNAIKYGREHGKVAITLYRTPVAGRRGAEGMVAVSVRDDGEGIPQEAIPRLTERFYRVDVKRSREKGGTGLGLAIVKHIVNRHGGRLHVESRLGDGSTFTITLPAVKKAAPGEEGLKSEPTHIVASDTGPQALGSGQGGSVAPSAGVTKVS